MDVRTNSGGELRAAAGAFVGDLRPRKDGATIVALWGELGAGKTTFAQGIAAALGVEETVTSPTFVIEKVYELEGRTFTHLIHIDAYRLKSAHELRVLGWEEIAREKGNIIVLEWPEKVSELIPESTIRIRFDIEGDGRIISIHGEEKDGTVR